MSEKHSHGDHEVHENSMEDRAVAALRKAEVLAKLKELGPCSDYDVQMAFGGYSIGWMVQPKITVLIQEGYVEEVGTLLNPASHRPSRRVRALEQPRPVNMKLKKRLREITHEAKNALLAGHEVSLVVKKRTPQPTPPSDPTPCGTGTISTGDCGAHPLDNLR